MCVLSLSTGKSVVVVSSQHAAGASLASTYCLLVQVHRDVALLAESGCQAVAVRALLYIHTCRASRCVVKMSKMKLRID